MSVPVVTLFNNKGGVGMYRTYVLGSDGEAPGVDDDPHCLAQLKHYRSLMPLAQEAYKPVFLLKPADGAFGGHQRAVVTARQDFAALARVLLAGIEERTTRAGAED